MIFTALYEMTKRGALRIPVIGVARSNWTLSEFRRHVKESVEKSGLAKGGRGALDDLLSSLSYVAGDYKSESTFSDLKDALGRARHGQLWME